MSTSFPSDDAILARVRAAVAEVADPELPPLTIEDLGILRDVRRDGDTVEVAITPTYSGCPAMREITAAVEHAARAAGADRVRVRLVLSPAWGTDALTDAGRRKLADMGIAPPGPAGGIETPFGNVSPPCPRCGAADTERISAFGATACKALHRCRACREPFEAFRCH